MSDIFNVPAAEDTFVSGLSGGSVHARETPFGCGSIADQSVGNGKRRHIQTFNRFNQEVDSLLADKPAFDSLMDK